MLYRITDGSVSLEGQEVLSHFSFEIKGAEKIALCGKNGSGKTTLLKLLAGELSLDRDDKRKGRGIETAGVGLIGYLPQHVFAAPGMGERTVEEELLAACPCKDSFDRERFDYEQEYDRLFTGFGFKKEDKKRALSSFSGGQQTRIALIRLLLMRPDLLLLDEPTNHLDEEMTVWLEDYIRHYDKAVVMVSHDRYFLDHTAQSVYEISNKRLTKYAGNYSFYMEEKERVRKRRMEEWTRQQEEIDRLNGLIKKFHNKPRKASFARSRQKILERMEVMEKPEASSMRPFAKSITPGVLPAKYVLEAEELCIGYDEALLELSLRIRRGQKIGIIGPNGIGKSTFVKTVAGQLAPVKGKCLLGERVEMCFFDQHTADSYLSSEKGEALTVLSTIADRFPSMTDKEVRGLLGSWLFPGKNAAKAVSDLSGGEKSRLAFCRIFKECPNFLVLDEPTNHMDIESREMLESALRSYEGTVLFVSHDRYFIDRVADALLVFAGDGVRYYPFGYSHYMERLRKAKELAAIRASASLSGTSDSRVSASRASASRTSVSSTSGSFAFDSRASSFDDFWGRGFKTSDGETDFSEVGAIIRAEDMALVESMRNVPEAEKGRFKRISTEELYLDWKRSVMEEDMDRLAEEISAFEEEIARISMRIDCIELCQAECKEELEKLFANRLKAEECLEKTSKKLTELCLEWDENFHEEAEAKEAEAQEAMGEAAGEAASETAGEAAGDTAGE